jgi:hypothetical protein
LSQKILHKNDPEYDPHKSFIKLIAEQTKRDVSRPAIPKKLEPSEVKEQIRKWRALKTASTSRRKLFKPVSTKADALATINQICSTYDSKLDKAKYILKCKKRELALITSEIEKFSNKSAPVTEENCSISDYEDMEDHPLVVRLMHKYAKNKTKLIKQEIFNDT